MAGGDPESSAEPDVRQCAPCRGTGQIVSSLGGSPSTVTCPWCEGTGRFQPGHDAQAAKREAAEGRG